MSQFVDLETFIPDIKLDIRYATSNNFAGRAVYAQAKAFLIDDAAQALFAASKDFKAKGLGILVWDAYRPLSVSELFWKLEPENLRVFVSNPIKGSVHNRGCAIDMTLYDLKTGVPLIMPSDFDDFSENAKMNHMPDDPAARTNRNILQRTMEKHGFIVDPEEWWHYNLDGYDKYPVLDVSFEDAV